MSEFDRTKQSIGVNNLDDKSRKEMFNKFVGAGGEVVKEKKHTSPESGSRDNRSGSQMRSRKQSSSFISSGDKAPAAPKRNYEAEMGSFTNKLAIKFKCWLSRVTPFGSDVVNPGFMSQLNLNLKSGLMEMNMVGNDLLGNPETAPKVMKELDNMNPMFVEVLSKGHKLYDSTELYALLEPYQSSPDSPVPISRISESLYSIFRKMYYIYPYQETYKKAVSFGYDALQKIEKKPVLIYSNKKKKFNSELNGLFGALFEKIYLIIIRNEKKNIPLTSPYMEKLLGISNEEKLGNRQSGQSVGDIEADLDMAPFDDSEEEESLEEEEVQKEEDEQSKEMQYGIKLMKMNSISELRAKYDPKGEFKNIPDSDKSLLSYLYFLDFDEEYSFVMTTKKISLKITNIGGNKVDLRQKMLDIYETSRGPVDQFKQYNDIMAELSRHKQNPGSNYIEASKKTTSIEQKRSGSSRNVRVKIKDFLDKTKAALGTLVEDMKHRNEIVENKDDLMVFDMIEAKKHLNKKPIRQCLTEAYCYAQAFSARLESGDLFGGVVELSPDEMMTSFGVSLKKEEAETTTEQLLSEGLDND